MTKKVRIWIVTSVVWLIVLLVTEINGKPMGGLGLGYYEIKDFLIDYLIWGILPVVIGWGVWWIRRT